MAGGLRVPWERKTCGAGFLFRGPLEPLPGCLHPAGQPLGGWSRSGWSFFILSNCIRGNQGLVLGGGGLANGDTIPQPARHLYLPSPSCQPLSGQRKLQIASGGLVLSPAHENQKEIGYSRKGASKEKERV